MGWKNGKEQSHHNRELAILNGEKVYLSVTPCPRCGKHEKYVSSMSCKPCSVKAGLEKLANKSLMAPYRTKAKVNNKTYRYRTRKRGQCPPDADKEKILEIYRKAERLTEMTGIPHQVDHIIPISKGGLHHHDNLQVLTREENARKADKV